MKMIEKTDGDCNVILVPEESNENCEWNSYKPMGISGYPGPTPLKKSRIKPTNITPKKKKRK